MDEEGFRKYLLSRKKRSPRGPEVYIKILKKYETFLQKHRNRENIDFSTKSDLRAFSKWLKEENFQNTIVDRFELILKEYFTFIKREELVKLSEKVFR